MINAINELKATDIVINRWPVIATFDETKLEKFKKKITKNKNSKNGNNLNALGAFICCFNKSKIKLYKLSKINCDFDGITEKWRTALRIKIKKIDINDK